MYRQIGQKVYCSSEGDCVLHVLNLLSIVIILIRNVLRTFSNISNKLPEHYYDTCSFNDPDHYHEQLQFENSHKIVISNCFAC